MTRIELEIPMKCPPMPRPRSVLKGRRIHIYMPWKSAHKDFKEHVTNLVPKDFELWTGPVEVSMVFTKKYTNIIIDDLLYKPTQKRADIDNLVKMVFDTIQGRIIHNDKQIFELAAVWV